MLDKETNIFIDRNPIFPPLDLELISGRKLIQNKFDIKTIFLGYNKLTTELFSGDFKDDPWGMLTGWPSIGHTSTMGFDLEEMKSLIQAKENVHLCFYAIPIDEMDLLVENPNYEDWDVENYLSEIYNCNIISVGSISFGGHKRCRTIKLILSP